MADKDSTQSDLAAAQKDLAATAKKSGIDEAAAPAGVQSVTTTMPAEADKTSLPNAEDAKLEDPPVRTSHPDTPIAQTLAAGAGEHKPPDPAEYDSAGRPRHSEQA